MGRDRKPTSISFLAAQGVRQDDQKVLLAVNKMGRESEAAWRRLPGGLVKRGLQTSEIVVADGAPGLDIALAALWDDTSVQRCRVR